MDEETVFGDCEEQVIHMCQVCNKWPRMSQVDDGGVGGMICQVCYYDL